MDPQVSVRIDFAAVEVPRDAIPRLVEICKPADGARVDVDFTVLGRFTDPDVGVKDCTADGPETKSVIPNILVGKRWSAEFTEMDPGPDELTATGEKADGSDGSTDFANITVENMAPDDTIDMACVAVEPAPDVCAGEGLLEAIRVELC